MKTINLKITEEEYAALVSEQEAAQLKTGRKQPLADMALDLCRKGMEAAAAPQGNTTDGALASAVLDQARFLAEWERRLNQRQREVWKELEELTQQARSGSAKRCAQLERENKGLAQVCKAMEERLAGHRLELEVEKMKGEMNGRETAVTELLKAQAEELDHLRRSVRDESRKSSDYVAELQKSAVMALTMERQANQRTDGDWLKQLLTLLAAGVAGAALATVAQGMLNKDDKPKVTEGGK